MKRMLVVAVLLGLASVAATEPIIPGASGHYDDAANDAPAPWDIRAVFWSAPELSPTPIELTLTLAAQPDASAGYTVVFFAGTEGAPEPDQWFVAHSGPGGDHVRDGLGADQEASVARNGTAIRWNWDAAVPADSCAFAVARSVSYQEGGQTVEDVVGWTNENIGDAWNDGAACSGEQPVDAVHTEKATPMPIGIALAAIFLAARRR